MEGGHKLEEDAEAKLSWALKATVNYQNRKCVDLEDSFSHRVQGGQQ